MVKITSETTLTRIGILRCRAMVYNNHIVITLAWFYVFVLVGRSHTPSSGQALLITMPSTRTRVRPCAEEHPRAPSDHQFYQVSIY